MTHKTSEIHQALKAIRDEFAFGKKDIIYAISNQNSGVIIRTELLNINPDIIDHLKEKGLIKETSFAGCQLTDHGSQFLTKFKEKEISTEKYISEFFSKRGDIGKSISKIKKARKGRTLDIKTNIKYNQTLEERKFLDELIKKLDIKMTVEDDRAIRRENKTIREYIFTNHGGKRIASLISERRLKRRGKGIPRYNKPLPLEIKVDLEYPQPEIITKLLNHIIHAFYYHKPLD